MKKQLMNILAIAILTITPAVVFAQGPSDPPSDPVDAPIDGGVSLLVAAGVAYGAKKAHDARKKKAE